MVTAPQLNEAPRSEATRRAILDAAQALLLEVGVERLSIRRVSERCGFKAPTIYHHFRDTREMLLELTTAGASTAGATASASIS